MRLAPRSAISRLKEPDGNDAKERLSAAKAPPAALVNAKSQARASHCSNRQERRIGKKGMFFVSRRFSALAHGLVQALALIVGLLWIAVQGA